MSESELEKEIPIYGNSKNVKDISKFSNRHGNLISDVRDWPACIISNAEYNFRDHSNSMLKGIECVDIIDNLTDAAQMSFIGNEVSDIGSSYLSSAISNLQDLSAFDSDSEFTKIKDHVSELGSQFFDESEGECNLTNVGNIFSNFVAGDFNSVQHFLDNTGFKNQFGNDESQDKVSASTLSKESLQQIFNQADIGTGIGSKAAQVANHGVGELAQNLNFDFPQINFKQLNLNDMKEGFLSVSNTVESVTGISATDAVSQLPVIDWLTKCGRDGDSEDGNSNSDGLNDFHSVFSELQSIGGDVAEILYDSKQFFTQLGALVGVFGTLVNTGSNVLEDYQQGKFVSGAFNLLLLTSVQLPTILAMVVVLFKDKLHLSLKGFLKVKEDVRELVDDLDSLMGTDSDDDVDDDSRNDDNDHDIYEDTLDGGDDNDDELGDVVKKAEIISLRIPTSSSSLSNGENITMERVEPTKSDVSKVSGSKPPKALTSSNCKLSDKLRHDSGGDDYGDDNERKVDIPIYKYKLVESKTNITAALSRKRKLPKRKKGFTSQDETNLLSMSEARSPLYKFVKGVNHDSLKTVSTIRNKRIASSSADLRKISKLSASTATTLTTPTTSALVASSSSSCSSTNPTSNPIVGVDQPSNSSLISTKVLRPNPLDIPTDVASCATDVKFEQCRQFSPKLKRYVDKSLHDNKHGLVSSVEHSPKSHIESHSSVGTDASTLKTRFHPTVQNISSDLMRPKLFCQSYKGNAGKSSCENKHGAISSKEHSPKPQIKSYGTVSSSSLLLNANSQTNSSRSSPNANIASPPDPSTWQIVCRAKNRRQFQLQT